MTSNTDGILFGNDNQVPNGYRDIYFGGIGSIFIDTSQDGKGAIEISSFNIVTVEFKKELDSEDSSGNDIQWIENNLYAIVIMWDFECNRSSGGTANHRASALIGRTLYYSRCNS